MVLSGTLVRMQGHSKAARVRLDIQLLHKYYTNTTRCELCEISTRGNLAKEYSFSRTRRRAAYLSRVLSLGGGLLGREVGTLCFEQAASEDVAQSVDQFTVLEELCSLQGRSLARLSSQY